MKKLVWLMFLLILTGCPSTKVLVRSLESTIVEAAKKAKTTKADSLTVEVYAVSSYGGKAGGTIWVVDIGGEASIKNSTKITAHIKDLQNWNQPGGVGDNKLYELDTTTYMLQQVTDS